MQNSVGRGEARLPKELLNFVHPIMQNSVGRGEARLPKELLNFVHPIMQPTVWCSAVGDDGYPPDNLISSDLQQFGMGFMAYPVEKPPIELVFTFCCPITLRSMKLWTRLGSLQTTGLEIYVVQTENADSEYVKVGSSFNLTEDGVEFHANHQQTATAHAQLRSCSFFRTLYPRMPVKKVKVCIKTTARCTPVLKKIEILGIPHARASPHEKRVALQRWTQRQQMANIHDSDHSACISTAKSTQFNPVICTALAIPDEFMDSLTHEIMALPMCLPSGKMLDKSSLDRHAQNEQSWGRPPSDPFTGVTFTAHRKPILDAVLKSQIDRFLLQNSHRPETKSVPRTVGGVAIKRTRLPYSSYVGYSKKIQTDSAESVTQTTSVDGSSKFDEAVQNALKAITRFTVPMAAKIDGESVNEQCLTCFTMDMLYRIHVCSHFVCRACLLKAGAEPQCSCGTRYSRSNIVRFYMKKM